MKVVKTVKALLKSDRSSLIVYMAGNSAIIFRNPISQAEYS